MLVNRDLLRRHQMDRDDRWQPSVLAVVWTSARMSPLLSSPTVLLRTVPDDALFFILFLLPTRFFLLPARSQLFHLLPSVSSPLLPQFLAARSLCLALLSPSQRCHACGRIGSTLARTGLRGCGDDERNTPCGTVPPSQFNGLTMCNI